jgi:hypothetical protein
VFVLNVVIYFLDYSLLELVPVWSFHGLMEVHSLFIAASKNHNWV